MIHWKRRHVLCGIAAVAASYAGCIGKNRGAGFARTEVEGQELVVEFDESLEPDVISVVDPNGEGYAETSVSAGATRVTFDISMPYTPGEYRIIATRDSDEVAEAIQEISPNLEILDVGVGANRMDEMPEERGSARAAEGIVEVQNKGTGPESITRLRLDGYLPNDRDLSEKRSGIYHPEEGLVRSSTVTTESGEEMVLFTSTLPFSFDGDGVDCREEHQSGEFILRIHGTIGDSYSREYAIEYSSAESYDGCEIKISGRA